jgi:TatD DNase family protein
MYLIDTHAHLDMIKNMSPAEAVEKSAQEGVKYIINPGSSIERSKMAISYANKFPGVFASVGVHPHDAAEVGEKDIKILESLINSGDGGRNEKVVGVGEAGFDFFRNLSPRPDQERVFRTSIELALKYDLPLVIHNRDADDETFRVLKEYAGKDGLKGVVHCFSGDTAFAAKCLELGLFISFTGVITFPNARNTLEVVREVPLDRIFVETDAPFLAPQPKMGKENYPGYVKYVAEKIAEVKETTFKEIAEKTSANAVEFFSLKI